MRVWDDHDFDYNAQIEADRRYDEEIAIAQHLSDLERYDDEIARRRRP